jgi:hypothetical protein
LSRRNSVSSIRLVREFGIPSRGQGIGNALRAAEETRAKTAYQIQNMQMKAA